MSKKKTAVDRDVVLCALELVVEKAYESADSNETLKLGEGLLRIIKKMVVLSERNDRRHEIR